MVRSSKSVLVLSLVAIGVAVGGCDVIFNLFPPKGGETGKSQLLPFESEKALSDYLRDQIARRNGTLNTLDRQFEEALSSDGSATGGPGGAGGDAAPPSLSPTGNGALADNDDGSGFSGTTIQEAGVDEADVVKTDGTYLYVLTTEWPDSSLRIVDVSDPTSMAEVARVELEGYGQDLYLYGDTIVALTSNGGGFYYFGGIAVDAVAATDDDRVVDAAESGVGQAGADRSAGGMEPAQSIANTGSVGTMDITTTDLSREPAPDATDSLMAPDYEYERPRVTVTVVNVADRANPTVESLTRLDGAMASSRMIDGVLHLVAANYQTYYYDVLPLLGTSRLDVATLDTADLLPRYTRVNADGSEDSAYLVTWENLYRPTDPDGFGIVYAASMDLDANATLSAVGVVAEPGLIYSSRQALYLTDTAYDFTGGQRTTTDLYKLAYANRGAAPVATGTVPGRILNQYSMGEHEGYLRVATTVDATFGPFGQLTPATNHVYVLGENDGDLSIVGSVEGIAPRETIQAARFLGDKGFVVTFEQIDPLFTLDLSDPTNPRVVGELKVPGFSTFLVPIDADHLLAVGQHVPPPGEPGAWGVQLSIFDVTDFAQPRLMDRVTIGDDTGAYSEALYNPKAFTYFAARGTVALPVSIYDYSFGVAEVDVDREDTSSGSTGGGSSGSTGGTDAVPPSMGDLADEPRDDETNGVEPYVPEGFEGLVVYSVSLETGLTEVGRLSTRFPEAGIYWSSYTRGVFIGDEVLAVTDNGVRGALVSEIEADQFELLFDRSYHDENGDSSPPSDGGGADGVSPDAPVSDGDAVK